MLFTTADDVHDSLGRLMQELATDPDVGHRLSRLNTVVQLRYRNPDTAVTLVAREGDAPTVHLGDVPSGTPNPEVVVTLDADVGHELWLGRQNVTVGIARGVIQAKGDARLVLELLGLKDDIAPHYEQLLRSTGREHLIDPQPVADGAAEEAPGAEGDEASGAGADGSSVGDGSSSGEAAAAAAAAGDEAATSEGDEAATSEGDQSVQEAGEAAVDAVSGDASGAESAVAEGDAAAGEQ